MKHDVIANMIAVVLIVGTAGCLSVYLGFSAEIDMGYRLMLLFGGTVLLAVAGLGARETLRQRRK